MEPNLNPMTPGRTQKTTMWVSAALRRTDKISVR